MDAKKVMERHEQEYRQELKSAVINESEYTCDGVITDFYNFKRSTQLKLISHYIKVNQFDSCHFEETIGFMFHDMLNDCSQSKILDFGKSLINQCIAHYACFIQYDIDFTCWDYSNSDDDDYDSYTPQQQSN